MTEGLKKRFDKEESESSFLLDTQAKPEGNTNVKYKISLRSLANGLLWVAGVLVVLGLLYLIYNAGVVKFGTVKKVKKSGSSSDGVKMNMVQGNSSTVLRNCRKKLLNMRLNMDDLFHIPALVSFPILTFRTEFEINAYKDFVKVKGVGMFVVAELVMANFNKEVGFVIDWGSNYGMFSIIAAKFGYDVYAIEPQPETVKKFYYNLDLNCVSDKVKLAPIGLSDRRYMGKISESYHAGENYIDGMFIKREGYKMVDVQLDKWDNVVYGRMFPNFPLKRAAVLKIDIQGSENAALKGAERYFGEYPPYYVFVAVNFNTLEDAGLYMLQYLVNLGYKLYYLGKIDGAVSTKGASPNPNSETLEYWYQWKDRNIKDVTAFVNRRLLCDVIAVHPDVTDK